MVKALPRAATIAGKRHALTYITPDELMKLLMSGSRMRKGPKGMMALDEGGDSDSEGAGNEGGGIGDIGGMGDPGSGSIEGALGESWGVDTSGVADASTADPGFGSALSELSNMESQPEIDISNTMPMLDFTYSQEPEFTGPPIGPEEEGYPFGHLSSYPVDYMGYMSPIAQSYGQKARSVLKDMSESKGFKSAVGTLTSQLFGPLSPVLGTVFSKSLAQSMAKAARGQTTTEGVTTPARSSYGTSNPEGYPALSTSSSSTTEAITSVSPPTISQLVSSIINKRPALTGQRGAYWTPSKTI